MLVTGGVVIEEGTESFNRRDILIVKGRSDFVAVVVCCADSCCGNDDVAFCFGLAFRPLFFPAYACACVLTGGVSM